MFIFYNPNPDKTLVGDCVVRALCKVLNEDWETVAVRLSIKFITEHDMPSSNRIWSSLLTDKGFKRHIIPDTCPDCYTVKDFCIDNPTGLFLLAIGEHVVAVENGDYYDTWDSGDEHPIFYWSLEN